MIKERPSSELDEIYASRGVVVGEAGSENKAPDATSSDGVKKGTVSEEARVGEVPAKGEEEIPDQAKGKGAAPDGTATPESMVYDASTSTAGEIKSAGKEDKSSTRRAAGSTSKSAPKLRHPNLLLGSNQVQLLAKKFDLKSQEMMDVVRAVEQADGRARAADKQIAEEEARSGWAGSQGKKPSTNWRGNLHR